MGMAMISEAELDARGGDNAVPALHEVGEEDTHEVMAQGVPLERVLKVIVAAIRQNCGARHGRSSTSSPWPR